MTTRLPGEAMLGSGPSKQLRTVNAIRGLAEGPSRAHP